MTIATLRERLEGGDYTKVHFTCARQRLIVFRPCRPKERLTDDNHMVPSEGRRNSIVIPPRTALRGPRSLTMSKSHCRIAEVRDNLAESVSVRRHRR